MNFFMADAGTAMRTELSIMINNHLSGITEAWDGYNIWDLLVSSAGAFMSLFVATILVIFVGSMLTLLYCVHLRTGYMGAGCNCDPHLPGTAVHPLADF